MVFTASATNFEIPKRYLSTSYSWPFSMPPDKYSFDIAALIFGLLPLSCLAKHSSRNFPHLLPFALNFNLIYEENILITSNLLTYRQPGVAHNSYN